MNYVGLYDIHISNCGGYSGRCYLILGPHKQNFLPQFPFLAKVILFYCSLVPKQYSELWAFANIKSDKTILCLLYQCNPFYLLKFLNSRSLRNLSHFPSTLTSCFSSFAGRSNTLDIQHYPIITAKHLPTKTRPHKILAAKFFRFFPMRISDSICLKWNFFFEGVV